MLSAELHRLLQRQLKKSELDVSNNPQLEEFLHMVNEAYRSFDKDILHIENILEESSKELFISNQKLIAERDSTKNKLENIVDNVGGVIFETDLDGNFTYLNNAWEILSGYKLADTLGKNFRSFLYGENIDGNIKFSELFSNTKSETKFIFKHKRNEKVMWFELKSKLILNSNGFPIGYIGTIVDVTNLKNIEIELKRASEAKDNFLSTMSHEIRTPLNAVTGLANILLMEDYLPDQVENLKALKYSGEHLLGLINDLLDFDKIKSGKIKLVEKDFSIIHFLENINSHFSLRAGKKGVDFILKIENELPKTIIGDDLKLAQIVKNLLSNSLKFTDTGSITLSVKNLGVDKNKIQFEFKVIDTGIGISKDRQQLIFESFMQAESETSIKYGGTGLGLSISKKLLEIQGSNLIVESELGSGATFSFIITYKVSNRLNGFEPDMIKMQPNYEPLNINVLVAEDNKMNILIIKKFFANWKVNYEIAENGKELLDIFEKRDFNLILMDLQMPLLDGYQTTSIIRKLPNPTKCNVPIIALTAFAQTDIKKKTQQYKMNGFMGKPFNPIKLYNLLKSYSIDTLNNQAV
ncbi:ATP-binding protein [Mariniflexile gromovii]|uniref:histidine kinase n=1 Tax=Mariniflexile gromovii TaxID=362523 RepID=A0ABS4BSP5_9FLAO|nr:ATP-binding protein [Mariniflexile gromovii]MBP0903433.1 response regulator [Mariniflexile gromovii]